MRREAAFRFSPPELAREELAKAWLIKVIERTPAEEIGRVPVQWIAAEAPALIADILRDVPASGQAGEISPESHRRARELSKLRPGGSFGQLPQDLAALQAVLIQALAGQGDGERGGFAAAVERLAESFGTVQRALVESLVEERSGSARRDEATGLPGAAHLHEWLRILLAEYRRYAHPFSVLLIDVDGLQRINEGYGRQVGDRMLAAVAGAVERQIRGADQAFRLADDEFCVVIPHQVTERVRPLADRLASTVNAWQGPEGPRVTLTVGVASCPEHGDSAERLLAAAEEASYAAKAAGRPFAVASARPQSFVQDSHTT